MTQPIFANTKTEFDVHIITINQDLTSDNLDLFEELLSSHDIKNRCNLVINFRKVKNMCSSALGALTSYRQSYLEKHGDIKLANISPELMKLLEITMLHEVFELYLTNDLALSAFSLAEV